MSASRLSKKNNNGIFIVLGLGLLQALADVVFSLDLRVVLELLFRR